MDQRRAIFEYRNDEVPAGTLVLEGAEAVAAIAHPLRAKMLTQLGSPKSVRELAGALEVPPSRLYHHVKRLTEAGIIAPVAGRQAGSNTERLFRVTARRIEVAGPAAAGGAEAAIDVFTAAGRIGDELARSMLADELAVLGSVVVSLDAATAIAIAQRLVHIVDEIAQTHRPAPNDDARSHIIQVAVTRTEQPVGRHVLASSVDDVGSISPDRSPSTHPTGDGEPR